MSAIVHAHAVSRVAIALLCALALLTGRASASTADHSTELPLSSGNYKTWLAVDPQALLHRAELRPSGTARPAQTWEVGAPEYRVLDHDLAFSPDGSKLFAVLPDAAEDDLAFHVLAVRPR